MRKLSGSMKRDAVFVQHAASVIAFSGVVINYSVCLLWTMVLSHASLISKEVLYVERVFIVCRQFQLVGSSGGDLQYSLSLHGVSMHVTVQ